MRRTAARPGPALAVLVLCLAAACGGGGDGDALDQADDSGATGPGARTVQVTGAGDVRLTGTLSIPTAATSGSVPGVLLVPSAGPGDRNGVTGPTGLPDALASDIAEALAGAGLASLRYDRRGTGESKLDPGTRLSFDDLVADARAGLDLLAERKETAGRDLAVVGYDQGGLVALRLAAQDTRVKRLVLISTPGRSLVDVQAAEFAARYGQTSADAFRATIANLLATRTVPPLESLRSEFRPVLPAQEGPFLAELYGLDPVADAAHVKASTLIAVPGDPAPYDPGRLDSALANAEVITAPAAGPTLVLTGPPSVDERSDPTSVNHEHGAPPPVVETDRDAVTLGRISSFLATGRAGSG